MPILTFIIIFGYKQYLTLRIDIQSSLFNNNHLSLSIYNRVSYLFSFLHFPLTPCSLFSADKQCYFAQLLPKNQSFLKILKKQFF